MRGCFLLALVLAMAAGCASYKETDSPLYVETEKKASAVPVIPAEGAAEVSEAPPVRERFFEEAGIGFTGPSEKEYRAFESWDEMASYIPSEDMFVHVDFSRDMVLACFMGEKPTGGYMNQITGMEESAELITVYVEITKPEEGDLVAQMVTSPWYAVLTEKTDKRLEWKEVRAGR